MTMGLKEDCLRCSKTGRVKSISAWVERPPKDIAPLQSVRENP